MHYKTTGPISPKIHRCILSLKPGLQLVYRAPLPDQPAACPLRFAAGLLREEPPLLVWGRVPTRNQHIVILSRSEEEAKNPYDETDNSIVLGILRRSAPQNDTINFLRNESKEMNITLHNYKLLSEVQFTSVDLQPLREYNDHVDSYPIPMILSVIIRTRMTFKQDPYLTQEVSMHRSPSSILDQTICVSDGGVFP
jgi:hypothetical protein